MLILPKIKCCWAKEKPEKTVKQTALFLCFLSINGYTWGHNHEVQQIRKDISPCYEAQLKCVEKIPAATNIQGFNNNKK